MKAQKVKLLTVIVALMSLVMTACNDGSSGSKSRTSGYTNGYYNQNGLHLMDCPNCNNTNLLADAVGVVDDLGYSMEMGLGLFTNSNYGTSDFYGNYTSYNGGFTSGMVEASGFLNVIVGDYALCPIPNGEYQLYTEQPGQLAGLTMVNGLKMRAQHYTSQVDLIIEMNPNTTLTQGSSFQSYNNIMGIFGMAYITVLGANGNPLCQVDVRFMSPM